VGSPIEYQTPLHAPEGPLEYESSRHYLLSHSLSLERFVKGSEVCARAYGSCYVITMTFLFWYPGIPLLFHIFQYPTN